MTLLSEISSILNMKVPLPAILETRIPIPALGTSLFPSQKQSITRSLQVKHRESVRAAAKGEALRSSDPVRFIIEGEVQKREDSFFCVRDHLLKIDENTWLVGDLCAGKIVKVKGQMRMNGDKIASSVVVF